MKMPYEEKTGNPVVDNDARNRNRSLRRVLRKGFRVTARNRRRKAIIVRAEFPRYAFLVAHIAHAEAEKNPVVNGRVHPILRHAHVLRDSETS